MWVENYNLLPVPAQKRARDPAYGGVPRLFALLSQCAYIPSFQRKSDTGRPKNAAIQPIILVRTAAANHKISCHFELKILKIVSTGSFFCLTAGAGRICFANGAPPDSADAVSLWKILKIVSTGSFFCLI